MRLRPLVCRREDYTVSPVGLPSTTSYTFRAGFDSELANKEVVSTAGDGLVSKVRFEFDAQSHITVANSVLAVNADLSGRTTTAQQINGTWVQDAWHYSATGVATGHELATLRANLSMANITAYDYDNGHQPWIDLDQDQNQGTAANRGAGVGKSRAVQAQNRGTSEQLSLYIQ
jgi:hypothetical protein